MARFDRHPPPRRGLDMEPKTAAFKSRKHKIILESVTQEKKKLYSVLSFEAVPPPGYTFVPAGNPTLTTQCKEMSREQNQQIYTVSTTPHKNKNLAKTLSHQVHRIGHHFRSQIVYKACSDLGLYFSNDGTVKSIADYTYDYGNFKARRERADSEESQTMLNTEARDTIKDLFPNIPDKDLNQIISTAFQKGTKKVGTAAELPLVRRAQLAVVAHIRHVYTNYDRLLRVGTYQDARSSVEQKCLEMLVDWRGSDENGARVLEDVFREVIVISDDEGSDYEEDEDIPHRDSSIEVISSAAPAQEIQIRPLGFTRLGATDTQYLSEDEAPTGYRIVPAGFRKKASEKKKIDRRGFTRYQAWDQAFDRYRRGPYEAHQAQSNVPGSSTPQSSLPILEKSTSDRIHDQPERQYIPRSVPAMEPPGGSSRTPVQYVSSFSRAPPESIPPQYTVYRREQAPSNGLLRLRNDEDLNVVHIVNGAMTSRSHNENENEIIQLQSAYGPALPKHNFPPEPVIYSPDKVRDHVTESSRPTHRRHGSLDMTLLHQNTVLPSIEGPQFTDPPRSSGNVHKEKTHRNPESLAKDYIMRPLTPQLNVRRAVERSQRAFPKIMESEDLHPHKRRRLLPDRSFSQVYPAQSRPVVHDRQVNVPLVVGPSFEEARPLLVGPLASDPEQGNTSNVTLTDRRIFVRQHEPDSRGAQDNRSQFSLRAFYEPLQSPSDLSRQNRGHYGAHVLANDSAIPHHSPDLQFKPSPHYSQVDGISPSVIRNDETFVRPVRYREIARPLSEIIDKDRHARLSKLSPRVGRDYGPGTIGPLQSYPEDDRASNHHIRYIPIPSSGADSFSVRGSEISTNKPMERVNVLHRRVQDSGAVRQNSSYVAAGASGRTVVSHFVSKPNLRRSFSPDQLGIHSSYRAPVTESLSAFPSLRRSVQSDVCPPPEQAPPAVRSEREIRRDGPIATQYHSDNEPMLHRVQYEDRGYQPIPGGSGRYRQPVATRGEVVVLD